MFKIEQNERELVARHVKARIDTEGYCQTSEGSLLAADLLGGVARLLESAGASNALRELQRESRKTIARNADETDRASYLWEEVCDAMDEIAPQGYYFGSSEGDGASCGFWVGMWMWEDME